MKKFPGCQFGPMQVRPALREDRLRGERIIGWATGRLRPERSAELFMVGLMHIPAVGPLFAALILAKQARFFVLTDRRFLILPVERAALRRANRTIAISLGEVALTRGGRNRAGAFRVIRAEYAGKSYLLEVHPRKKSRPTNRLIEALRMLVTDAESPPTIPSSGA